MGAESSREDRLFRGMVSVKGVVRHRDGLVLLKNQRGEWELPGGKLEIGESIAECLAREFREELALGVEMGPLLDVGLHHFYPDTVVIVYGCRVDPDATLRHSDEHHDVGCFTAEEIETLDMAPLYRRASGTWFHDAGSTQRMRDDRR
jgi:8-oxo-dGTP pyrophosphatase MutT (NUDIX family)